jgi:uncharacterized damage-inducible protein DinB
MNINDIRQLFAYTEWANALVLDAAEKLTPAQLLTDVQISHGSLLGTLLHMAGAEWVWLERWHGRSHTGPAAWARWQVEQCPDVATLRTNWEQVAAERRAYLAELTDEDLARVIAFKRVDGSAASLPLGQQLQHVVNHATLHRGQVVGMIRQLGLAPPATDLLFYYRAQQQ